MEPERTLEHAERVRQAYQRERELARLERKVQAGHENLAGYRDRLARKIGGSA